MRSRSEKAKDRKIMNLLTSALLCGSLELFLPSEATGQILPDSTLGAESSVVTPENINGIPSDIINGGATRGANLFHSFSEFNVREGGAAYFANPAAIENILTRVTGSNGSNIFGTLGVLGNANLFLINPHGIVFGPNARLDLGGSFVGSSANSVIFENGFEFSATDPQAPPLLRINIPMGLNLRQNPGSIVVEGPGHNLRESNFVTVRDDRPEGLQVSPGQTLALVGGDVVLSGGNLTAEDGTVALWSVLNGSLQLTTSNGQLSLENSQSTTWGDIRLGEAASVDVSGNGGGNVQVRGRNIQLTDGSAIIANTLGNSPGGSFTVNASESVELMGISADGNYSSRFLTEVEPDATGDGAALTISTQRLTVRDGAFISNTTFGAGNGGNITMQATEVEVSGRKGGFPSGLFNNADELATENAKAGILTIETENLTVSDEAQITTSTFGAGDGGTIRVQATNMEVIGGNSRLLANVQAGSTGAGGFLTIVTEFLTLRDGAQISTSTGGAGNAGTISLQATELEAIGTSADGRFPSGLFANVRRGATGDGGSLTIGTERLVVRDGAQITVSTFSTQEGDAGDLTVQATEVELIGTDRTGEAASGLFASVQPGATGNAGDLTIETARLVVRDGARVSDGTLGNGNGGNLTVRATESVELSGRSVAGFPSLIIAGVEDEDAADVRGGNLTIDTARIVIRDGGQISAGTIGAGKAGDITIRASESVELIGTVPEVSDENIPQSEFSFREERELPSGEEVTVFPSGILAASTGTGDAGTLTLQTEEFSVRDGATVTVSSANAGEAGNLTIAASEVRLKGRDSGLSAETVEGEQANINLTAGDLQLRRGAEISTNATGTATGGNITLSTETLVALENSDISANAQQSFGGQVRITAEGIFGTEFREEDTSESDITATSDLGAEFSGTVEILTPDIDPGKGLIELSQNVVDAAELIAKDFCRQAQDSEFIITGRGGLPPNPNEDIISNDTRVNWIEPVGASSGAGGTNNGTNNKPQTASISSSEIVPARGWIFKENGEVLLVGYDPTQTGPIRNQPTPHTCRSAE
ncbi:MAG: filamentous hemagglutinin N-terminal domain-containing protein [Hormoscilla sp.]